MYWQLDVTDSLTSINMKNAPLPSLRKYRATAMMMMMMMILVMNNIIVTIIMGTRHTSTTHDLAT